MADLAITEHAEMSLAMVLVRRGARAMLAGAVQEHLGLALPAPGRLTEAGGVTLLWHGPDRFLAVRDGAGSGLAQTLETALAGAAHVVEASASRVVATVAGDRAIDALGKLLPIDLHKRVFTPGSVALTRAAHIDVTVWRAGDAAAFGLACPASYADSFRHHLALL